MRQIVSFLSLITKMQILWDLNEIFCCRSESPVKLGEWVEVRVSRTGRLASLEVEDEPAQEVLTPGAFTQLSLPLNLYLGGAPSSEIYSPKMKTKSSFVGCIQTVILNRREVSQVTIIFLRFVKSYCYLQKYLEIVSVEDSEL